MPYPTFPGYSSLRQQAGQHRDQYEQEEAQGLEDLYQTNPALSSILGGQAGAINQMRQRQGMERAQANFNPQWDAWFQALNNITGGSNQLGGSSSLQGLQGTRYTARGPKTIPGKF